MIQIATRFERGLLHPYVSPKKPWDQPLDPTDSEEYGYRPIGPVAEQVVAASTRYFRRVRQRNLAAMGRKSRRKADRLAFEEKQNEQNLRGMARVYFGPCHSPAMVENVERAVGRFVSSHAEDKGIPLDDARAEVESMLDAIRSTYGDDL